MGEIHLFGKIALNREARDNNRERSGKPNKEDKDRERAIGNLYRILGKLDRGSPEYRQVLKQIRRLKD